MDENGYITGLSELEQILESQEYCCEIFFCSNDSKEHSGIKVLRSTDSNIYGYRIPII